MHGDKREIKNTALNTQKPINIQKNYCVILKPNLVNVQSVSFLPMSNLH